MHHELKIHPQYFASLASGERTAELRRNDRQFAAGDTITFREFSPQTDEYTGRAVNRQVSYVLHGPFNEESGFAVIPGNYDLLSLRRPSDPLRTGDDDAFTYGGAQATLA